jgi:hypothetical protein
MTALKQVCAAREPVPITLQPVDQVRIDQEAVEAPTCAPSLHA